MAAAAATVAAVIALGMALRELPAWAVDTAGGTVVGIRFSFVGHACNTVKQIDYST
ncbi:hypothetical protein GCM10023195_11280 [Actinoallomurus liliacearum]|uniref:Uncharacterized protein n=1 Tax=Actinoallomurus liliacearum TaxID=1080073 RepID=A0ABP8TBE9_9ACTN